MIVMSKDRHLTSDDSKLLERLSAFCFKVAMWLITPYVSDLSTFTSGAIYCEGDLRGIDKRWCSSGLGLGPVSDELNGYP